MFFPTVNFKTVTNILIAASLSICCSSTTTVKPNSIARVNSDTTYAISAQRLKSNKIPDSVFQMTELRHLEIWGMDCDYSPHPNCWGITEIPAGIKNLKNLTTIRLTLNAISVIPIELTELPNLTLIDFTDNAGLANIDNLVKITNLKYLYLYGCGLTKLPDKIGELKNLVELGLVGNNINKDELKRITKALPNCVIK